MLHRLSGDAVRQSTRWARSSRDLSYRLLPASKIRQNSAVVWVLYGVLSLAAVTYAVATVFRGTAHYSWWFDGWFVDAIEVVASLLCLLRGVERSLNQRVALALGLGLLAWAAGDVVVTLYSQNAAMMVTPRLANVFYLLYYPLAYVAVVFYIRGVAGGLIHLNWFDGIIAGLGAAALTATFAFPNLGRHFTHQAMSVVNLAFPVGDLLLLSLVVGAFALVSRRLSWSWTLIMTGILINVFGDSGNVFSSSSHVLSSALQDINAFAWPTSSILMSAALWFSPRTSDPLIRERISGFGLPTFAAAASLGILTYGSFVHLSRVAVILATSTLAVTGLRLLLSANDLRQLTAQRQEQAQTDDLTGIANRRSLFQVLDGFFDHYGDPWHTRRKLAFLFLDLNRFKEINDSFGHPAGDELLRQIGQRLQAIVGENRGSVFRVGGDEFVVVLLDVGAREALAAVKLISQQISRDFDLRGVSTSVGASIGIALAPDDASDYTGLAWCADAAMYRAKASRRAYAFYDEAVDGESPLSLLEDLRDALNQSSFVLHYQPQLDLHTGRVSSVEALIRWPHARLGLVPPLRFIPLAEESGLMKQLTSWVLDEALAQCGNWHQRGFDISVSVNVSTSDLLHNDFCQMVADQLRRHSVPPELLVIEITESVIITDLARAKAAIRQLRQIGVGVSIDDFGAGFTSLAYLGSLDVSELKLDRIFITDLGRRASERDLELVRSTIHLGHDMGLRVVAEGIEDQATLDLLSELGCDIAQGFFIGMPMPPDNLDLQPLSLVTSSTS